MADKKISALTSASTPLAGTEVLPIVQSSSTVKVSVANLTAGRAVSMSTLAVGVASPSTTAEISGAPATLRVTGTSGTVPQVQIVSGGVVNWSLRANQAGGSDFTIYQDSTEQFRIASGGNITSLATYSATVGGTNRDVYVDNTGLIGYVTSIRASKTNIQPLATLNWLYQLTPVSFNYRKKDSQGAYTFDADGPIQYGLIAEDTEKFNPDLCFYDDIDGEKRLRGVNYTKLITPMLKAIQDLKAEVDSLKAQLLDAR